MARKGKVKPSLGVAFELGAHAVVGGRDDDGAVESDFEPADVATVKIAADDVGWAVLASLEGEEVLAGVFRILRFHCEIL